MKIYQSLYFFRLHHIDEQPSGGAAQDEVDFSKAFQVGLFWYSVDRMTRGVPESSTTSVVRFWTNELNLQSYFPLAVNL